MFTIQSNNWPIGYNESRRLIFDGKFITNGHWCCEANTFKQYFNIEKNEGITNEDYFIPSIPFHWIGEKGLIGPVNPCEGFFDSVIPDIEKTISLDCVLNEAIDLDICIKSASYFKNVFNNDLLIIQNQYEFFINELIDKDDVVSYRTLFATDDRLIIKETDKIIFMLMLLKETQDNLKMNLRDCSKHTY